jgi:FkbM family methyltransferase
MKVRLPNGLSIHAPNRIDARFLYHEIFVRNCYLRHGVELHAGATIFDVGANIGMFDVFLARALREFTIFAFEPIPQSFELLRRNTAPFADQVRLFNVGLSDHDGETTFTRFPRASALATCSPGHIAGLRAARNELIARGGGSREAEASGRRLSDWPRSVVAKLLDFYFFSGRETVRCRLRTLGDILKLENVDSIDLLKIDVENSEWEVLAGIDDAGWARIRQVVLEVHDIDGRLARILELLALQGYKVVADQEEWSRDFGVFNVYARKDADPAGARRPHAASRNAG